MSVHDSRVCVVKCGGYGEETVTAAFDSLFAENDFLDFVRPGMRVGVKLNLVAPEKPDKAATVHPSLVKELCRRISAKGALPVLGDSPGGPFAGVYLKNVYRVTGIGDAGKWGAVLNDDFTTAKCDAFEEADVLKNFTYTAWLKKCDVIINFAKLKTHGMMTMSAAVKNMFGAIPGTMKPEYHYRFPNPRDFASMLIDIDEYFKPVFSIVDGVVGMEGNGPTMGRPREIGIIAASASPYNLDAVCSGIIGLSPEKIPTCAVALERSLELPLGEIRVTGDGKDVVVPGFDNIDRPVDIEFFGPRPGFVGNIFNAVAKKALRARPSLRREKCIGCAKCSGICPAGAITMKQGKKVKNPKIDKGRCIRCFCCQEFCPVGALEVHRPAVARFLVK